MYGHREGELDEECGGVDAAEWNHAGFVDEDNRSVIVRETDISGLVLIEPELFPDERGYFIRMFSETDLLRVGIAGRFVQMNVGYNVAKGTVRGLHFQRPPASEAKLIRCIKGSIFDVAVDLRPESPTFLRAESILLDGQNMLYIPARFAHGYQALTQSTEVQYLLSAEWVPHMEDGIPYDDPLLAIKWPLTVSRISRRDLSWRPFAERSELIDLMAECVH